jgi:CSLREA domain-containing protein
MNKKLSVSRTARLLSIWCLIFFVCFAAAQAQSATFIVNSNADTDDGSCTTGAGGCTLREAINAANATAALDAITFNLGTGTPTITLTSGLPALNNPVTIDGSAGGATRVELNGSGAGNTSGLFVDGSGNTIRRLVINRFSGSGIYLNTSNNNLIEGNFIGTNADGAATAGFGNSASGIHVVSSQNSTIGGTTGTTPGGSCTGACNLISGNGAYGIYLESQGVSSSGNIIQGNFIGTDVTGTIGRGNNTGIRTFNSASNNQIGGATAAARNLISGNGTGIFINGGGSTGTIVQGNFIGTNSAGTGVVANGSGIQFFAAVNNITIGGTNAGAGNVISGNNTAGIIQTASNFGAASNVTIQGNFIGTDLTGTLDLGNGKGNGSAIDAVGGISLSNGANNNIIGGTAAGAANVIAFNRGAGVRLGSANNGGTPAAGANNSIRGNSIYLNNGLGISLSDGGGTKTSPLANDTLDADTGANNRQNYPILSGVSESGGTITVAGTLNSLANAQFNIDFYVSENADPSGSGEGQIFVGTQSVTTDANGDATISYNYSNIAGKPFTSATATNTATGDTSEFSNAVLLTSNPGTFVFSSATYQTVESAGIVAVIVNRANGSTGAACVDYTTADGTATAGSDYTLASGTLCFADGETTKTFDVTISDDTLAESPETINLTLWNSTNGSALGLQSAATISIINDDSFNTLIVNSIADTNDNECSQLGTGGGNQDCTLREAINAANSTASLDTINFDIGTGTPTLTPTSALPVITAPVIIDGRTGGATRVEINGNGLSGSGLSLNGAAGRSSVRFLVINRFGGSGILLAGDNNVIEGNYLGTNPAGTADLGNGQNGIFLSASNNNIIGGTTGTTPGSSCTGACNLISGNNNIGISLDSLGGSASGNIIQGNFIGTNATGTAALGNSQHGISLVNVSNNNQIGGTTAAARNLISGNGNAGVFLSAAGLNGNLIQGNYIGTNTNATAKIGNATGVSLFFTATGNTIGGTAAGAGNVISGNNYAGVSISTNGNPPNSPPNNNIVQSNFIGTNEAGALDLSNGRSDFTSQPVGGITISQGAFNNQIGGTSAGQANVIAFNYGAGIRLGGQTGAAAGGIGNSISGNSIYSNNGLGIALSDGAGILASQLPNDAGDADTGANNRQNYPVLSVATTNGGVTVIQGTLDSAANATYRIQFFSNAMCDSSGTGEGRAYLGELTGVAPNTTFTFNSAVAAALGEVVTATTTNETTGDTSEFSACQTVTAPADTTAPSVSSIDDGDADNTETVGATLIYTVSFNEDINASTVTAADFENAGSSSIVIGTITETSPGVFTVQVTPTSAGALQLRIPTGADIRDTSNNALIVPVTDDTTVTVNLPDNFASLVVTKTADTDDGACNADCSLREAISAANGDAAAETITFELQQSDPGYDANADLYTLTLASALPNLSTDITIHGPGAIYMAISGNNSTRVFNITAEATVNISELTITGGNSGNEGGGGIQNEGTLTLTSTAVRGNNAGGIGGAGIYNGVGAVVNVINSTISGNLAGSGNGGGIAGVGTINIINSTITGNSAAFGGGIITFSSVATTLTIRNSTISNNSAQNFGGGIAHQYSTPAILRNTIVAGNTSGTNSPNLGGTYTSEGYNLVGNISGATVTPTTGDQFGTAAAPIDPRLGPLQYNDSTIQTHALLPGSPALDKGNSSGSTTDQRNATRPVDLDDAIYTDSSDASDIGAFEAQTIPSGGNAFSFVVTKTADTDDGACNADCSLREAISAANDNPGEDFITFAIADASPYIIHLTAALPDLSQSVRIVNNSSDTVTVRRAAGGNYRIFTINDGQNVEISGLTVAGGNSSSEGGGIRNGNNARLAIYNSTISNNITSGFGGGGIYNGADSILNVTNSTISGNLATGNGNGGGIAGVGTITITNSTISDNNADYGGGIMTFSNTTLTVASSTVTDNSAVNFGGGILEQAGGATIRNTIVANNTAGNKPDVSGTFNSLGFNLIEDVSGATINETQNSGTNIIGHDPKLGALQNNGGMTSTRALLQGSPAIDKGYSFGLPTDQRGSTRPVNFNGTADIGDESDIGAFELQTVAANSISGVVSYGSTPIGDSPKFVPNVTLTAAGTPQVAATTDSVGAYSLSGLGNGAYTVTPTKAGNVNSINSLDASRIQQHLVGLITLTPNQLIAADTDGNGTVNSLDAVRIQQYQVGIPSQNIIGQWKFVPAARQYNTVNNNLTAENYVAILVGEVSGNWTSGNSFAESAEQEELLLTPNETSNAESAELQPAERITVKRRQSNDLNSITDSTLVSNSDDLTKSVLISESTAESATTGAGITVSLPANITAVTGSTITVPVSIGASSSGNSLESFDFTVFYDPAVLQPASPAGSNAGTLSANCSVLSNSPQSGRVVISGACATAISTASGGVLYNLQFNVLGTSRQQTGLLFDSPSTGTQTFQFNSGTPAANPINGLFSVLGPTAASVTVSGKVTNNQGRGIRNVLITMTDSQGRVQTAQTTAFGYYKFESVAAGETVTITAKARRFRFNQSSIVRTTNESITDADFVSAQ